MNRLKEVRSKLNLTQEQMADMMTSDKIRITDGAIASIELNRNNPSYNFMKAFKRTFPEYKIEGVFFYDV